MKIHLAKSAGFCFGVRRAIQIAYNTAKANANAVMLGDIVHNENVVRQIHNAGIKNIKRLYNGKGKILLIRAHGEPYRILKKARHLGYKIVDATCPMVKEIHNIAKDYEQKGYTIVIIGDKKHDEVRGISGQLKNKAIIIEDIKDIPFKKFKTMKKAAVVVQSTQNVDKVTGIVSELRKYFGELKFFNTICNPTRKKQKEIKIMPLENDVMIIIGSKTSANTRRLYEISSSLNKRSFWIASTKEIRPAWFRGIQTVGVTAGASTPDSTTKEVIEYIKKIGKNMDSQKPDNNIID
jgi:4-hydroxy-3-methylbut-2-enyl diphosphate reductase